MNLEEICRLLQIDRKTPGGYQARCPAHDDHKASLSISEGEKGVVLNCFVGCSVEEICSALGLELKDLFFNSTGGASGGLPGEPVRVFEIRTTEGHLIALRKRQGTGKDKRLWWEQPDGKNGLGGNKTAEFPLFGSERIKNFLLSRWVELSEGEAKTEELRSYGAYALGTVTGASSVPSAGVLESLRGRRVRLWPDNDQPGRAHMAKIEALLRGVASQVVTLDTSALPPKGDAVQWLERLRSNGTERGRISVLLSGEEGSGELPGLPIIKPGEALPTHPKPNQNPGGASGGQDVKEKKPRAPKPPTSKEQEEISAEEAADFSKKPKKGTIPGGRGTPSAFTDTGNAERLVHLTGGDARYCEKWKKWLIWTGACWEEDGGSALQRYAKLAASSFFEDGAEIVRQAREKQKTEVELEAAHKSAEAWSKHARQSLGVSRRVAMVELAKSEVGVGIDHALLDKDPLTFNCNNGTIDLRTGVLRPHNKTDLLTKRSPVDFLEGASAPTWLAFLKTIMGGDLALVECLQRAAGYSLSGSSKEQALFFLFGDGSNGKGTFIETLLFILGEYGYAAPSNLLLHKKGEQHPTDKASLFGRRFAATPEVEQGRWDEKMVKELTGGDTISARRMREDFWTFAPTHKLWVSGNNKPQVRGTDNGIWRRLKLIPFTVTIPDEKQDKDLPKKLRAEAPGILRWLVEGCLLWQESGLLFPEAVTIATKEYRSAEDMLGRFLEDRCTITGAGRVLTSDLYKALENWCQEDGEYKISKRLMVDRLMERGFQPARIGTSQARGWSGLELRNDFSPSTPSASASDLPGSDCPF